MSDTHAEGGAPATDALTGAHDGHAQDGEEKDAGTITPLTQEPDFFRCVRGGHAGNLGFHWFEVCYSYAVDNMAANSNELAHGEVGRTLPSYIVQFVYVRELSAICNKLVVTWLSATCVEQRVFGSCICSSSSSQQQ